MGEGESLWSLIICDHQMEQVNVPGYLSNWKFLSCFASKKQSGRDKPAVINQGVWF
jgi:hypothetical protein